MKEPLFPTYEVPTKFILPSYKILSEDFTRSNVLRSIEKAARTCYQSEGQIQLGSDVKLLKKLIELQHEAMLEHAPTLSVSFTTCRGVSHELVRHRLHSFAQESTRYVRYGKDGEGMQFILPPWIDEEDKQYLLSRPFTDMKGIVGCKNQSSKPMRITSSFNSGKVNETEVEPSTYIFLSTLIDSAYAYAGLIEQGWKAQQAREVLPNALKTEIVMTGNVRSWRHFFSLRLDKAAHPQMRELVTPLYEELCKEIPELWEDIREKVNW